MKRENIFLGSVLSGIIAITSVVVPITKHFSDKAYEERFYSDRENTFILDHLSIGLDEQSKEEFRRNLIRHSRLIEGQEEVFKEIGYARILDSLDEIIVGHPMQILHESYRNSLFHIINNVDEDNIGEVRRVTLDEYHLSMMSKLSKISGQFDQAVEDLHNNPNYEKAKLAHDRSRGNFLAICLGSPDMPKPVRSYIFDEFINDADRCIQGLNKVDSYDVIIEDFISRIDGRKALAGDISNYGPGHEKTRNRLHRNYAYASSKENADYVNRKKNWLKKYQSQEKKK